MYQTGAYPDRQQSRDEDRALCNFDGTTGVHIVSDDEFVQAIRWIRSQPKFPDCVGETVAAIVEASLPADSVRVSAVSIWRDARRRQGKIERIEEGTRLEYALKSLVLRGWDPYVEGEETDDEEAGRGASPAGDDLADEMFADDNRVAPNVVRSRIIGLGAGICDAVDEALRRGSGVGMGTGLTELFMSYAGRTPDMADDVLGLEYLSGTVYRHAQRIAGRGTYLGGRRKYLIQGSYGEDFAGCHAPDGTWMPGCFWADESAIVNANDIHVIKLLIAKGSHG